MTMDDHDLGTMGGPLVDGMSAEERRTLLEHLAGCERCRREQASLEALAGTLGELPPETLLDGPPDDADLVLQRALRQARGEADRATRRRRAGVGAAAAAVVALAVAGGAALGSDGDGSTPPDVAAPPASTVPPPPAGTRVASAADPTTGARATVRVEPAAGWVRVKAAVSGIEAGQRCRLWVVARDGTRQLAGSWLVSEAGERDGTTLDGSALVAPDDVAAVEVDNVEGTRFVAVAV